MKVLKQMDAYFAHAATLRLVDDSVLFSTLIIRSSNFLLEMIISTVMFFSSTHLIILNYNIVLVELAVQIRPRSTSVVQNVKLIFVQACLRLDINTFVLVDCSLEVTKPNIIVCEYVFIFDVKFMRQKNDCWGKGKLKFEHLLRQSQCKNHEKVSFHCQRVFFHFMKNSNRYAFSKITSNTQHFKYWFLFFQ